MQERKIEPELAREIPAEASLQGPPHKGALLMNRKKLSSILCLALTASLFLSGCSNTSAAAEDTTAEDTSDQTTDQAAGTVTAQITSIDGSQITASVGTLTAAQASEANGPADGDANATDSSPADGGSTSSEGTPPAKPEGDDASQDGDAPGGARDSSDPSGSTSSESTPPAKPEGDDASQGGDAPGGAPSAKPGEGGSSFEAGSETITFTVTDDTVITMEFQQGSQEVTAENLAVNQVIEVTLDDSNQAASIVIKNLQAGGFGGSDEVTNGTSAASLDDNASIAEEAYLSSGDDENALRADSVTASLSGVTIEKTGGASSNTENGDFYGQNAAFLALNGADVTITNAVVNTSAVNGNGIFSYGEGTTVTVSDTTIHTTERNSGGIQTTGGGTTVASNLTITTEGDSSAAIRSDRGGGTVTVDGGTYTTDGLGSPAVYSTADITVRNAQLTANHSEGLVIEGQNSITLENCTVSGNMTTSANGGENDNLHAVMIYQSMSGDAAVGRSSFSSTGGTITSLSGDLFYVTNTSCSIALHGTTLVTANGQLLTVAGNDGSRGWGTSGSNGGNVTFTASAQTMDGDITVDDISSLDLTLSEGSTFTGTINSSGTAGDVAVSLDDTSSWILTGDSYLSSFDGDLSQVQANGHQLYVDGVAML